jgi:CheY-like chemotaxis protein
MTPYALLIDDDRDTCNLFQMVMEHSGKSFSIAGNSDEALAILAENTPQIIIIDIFLPGLDGYQTFQRIQSNLLAPRALKIATTAYYTEDTETQAAQWGFDGFLAKPFNPTNLISFLEKLGLSKN